MRLREYMVGVILAAVLIACSTASTPDRGAEGTGLVATATLASGAAADSTGLVATATMVSGEQAATTSGLVATATVVGAALGQSVAVSGPVTTIHSAGVFELDDVAQGGVLVLVPTGSINVGQGQQVQVSGVMQQFDVAQLEQSLGTDIDDSLAASLAGRPVVIAEQIDATVAGP